MSGVQSTESLCRQLHSGRPTAAAAVLHPPVEPHELPAALGDLRDAAGVRPAVPAVPLPLPGQLQPGKQVGGHQHAAALPPRPAHTVDMEVTTDGVYKT